MHVLVVGKSGKLLKTPEKFPYHIKLRNEEEFYMAGVWQPVNIIDTGVTINTFSFKKFKKLSTCMAPVIK